jgi:molecular chaperone GrpE
MTRKNKTADEQEDQVLDQVETTEQNTTDQHSNGKDSYAESTELSNASETNELRQQLDELKDKYVRLFAEFDNYKKRAVKEKMEWMKMAAQDTMSALLPVLDDFDRAKKYAAAENDKGLSEGVELVYQKLYNTLRQKGLEPMDTEGQPFDPELHDAITEIPAPSEDLKGKIIDTIEKGYRLNDKIIRHAKVVVGK